jgi:hypothetical protein
VWGHKHKEGQAMKFVFFIGLMIAAYAGALWWRKKINREHQAFRTKMDLASDEQHARRLLQESLKKKGIK